MNTVFTCSFYGLAADLLVISTVKDKGKALLFDKDKKSIYKNANRL